MLIYANPTIVQLPLGVPEGLTLSNSTSTPGQVEIIVGRALIRRATGERVLATRTFLLKKNLLAPWAAGFTSNGLPSNVPLTANTIYHVFLIIDTNGVVDAYFDTSALAANRPSGWDARMIGSILTNPISGIAEFDQQDDRFEYRGAVSAADTANLSTSANNIVTLPTPSVASAIGTIYMSVPSGQAWLYAAAEADVASASWCTALPGTFLQQFWQINGNRMRLFSNVPNVTAGLRIRGFIHPRGSQL